jgi:hypothetical protein
MTVSKMLRSIFKVMMFSEALFIIVFGFPLLGAVSAGIVGSIPGCPISAAGNSCTVLGIDVGARLSVYAIPILGSILTPIALILVFWPLLLVWTLITFVTWAAARSNKRQEKETG